MKKNSGIFCVSLDFELYWGIRDKQTIEEYGENVLGVWKVVPRLLELFKENDIHATWAIVGAMLAENATDLKANSPQRTPQYDDKNLSPYSSFFAEMDKINPEYIFGKKLFELVKNTPNQELGTHTFTHYYCLESGQNKAEFLADLQASLAISKKNGFEAKSFIFPRHQLNSEYIKEFPNFGIECYRKTEKIRYNAPARGEDEGILKRAFRFADYYVPVFSQHCQSIDEVKDGNLYGIRASRWLRPYSKKWEKLDALKLNRIKSQMTYAAKNGKIFHLWFHPHDIGINIDKNFEYLDVIMKHYRFLQSKYNFKSANFAEIKQHIDGIPSV